MYFWKWWTGFVLSFVAVGYVQSQLDIFNFVLNNDPTYITFLIITILLFCSILIGVLSYNKQFKQQKTSKSALDMQWFVADAVMSLGMVGTLLGFLMVLTSTFQDVDTSSTEAMKEVIGQLASGMGTALLTSLAGLISSILLKMQLVMLESDNEEV